MRACFNFQIKRTNLTHVKNSNKILTIIKKYYRKLFIEMLRNIEN